MTVIDTGVAVDLLLHTGVAEEARDYVRQPAPLAAPDVLVFEVVAVLRRFTFRGYVEADRAAGAIDDMDDLRLEISSTMPLRKRAWELRENMSAADALFVALAERLDEPLATKDGSLVAAASQHTKIEVIELGTDG